MHLWPPQPQLCQHYSSALPLIVIFLASLPIHYCNMENLPDACYLVQFPLLCYVGVLPQGFCCYHRYWSFSSLQIVLTDLDLVRPIILILSTISQCVWHTSFLSDVTVVNLRVRSLQTRSESGKVQMEQN